MPSARWISRRVIAPVLMLAWVATAASLGAQSRPTLWRVAEQWRVDGTDAGDGFGDLVSHQGGSVFVHRGTAEAKLF